MKQTAILLILFSVTIIFAQFSSLQEVLEADKIKIDNHNGIVCRGDSIFATFIQDSLLYIATSLNNGEEFNIHEIETDIHSSMIYYDAPKIAFVGSTIYIFTNHYSDLYLYKSEDLGNSFSVEFLGDTSGFNLYTQNDELFILNKGSYYRESSIMDNIIMDDKWFAEESEKHSEEYYNKLNNSYLSHWNSLEKEVKQTKGDRNIIDVVETAEEFGICPVSDEADIAYVNLEGNHYTGYEGIIELVGYDTLNVYSWYPANVEQVQMAIDNGVNWFEDSNIISRNIIPRYETNWVGISGEIPDGVIMYVPCELWIMGEVQGRQNWVCPEKIRLLGDLTMAHTEDGNNPDGGVIDNEGNWDYERPINSTDMLYMLSLNRIEIAYKHRNPATGDVVNNNSEVEGEVNIFAHMTVISVDSNDYSKGMFTFEYQHPHGSTPDFEGISPYTGNDTIYTNIDLHKFVLDGAELLPPYSSGFGIHGNNPINNSSCGYPYESDDYIESFPNNEPENYVYPYGADYPWYNPVWPESAEEIVFERGELRFAGRLAQSRRGFIHRSGSDPYNHQNNVWNLEEQLFDGEHHSTGYNVGITPISDLRWIYGNSDLTIGNFGNTDEFVEFELYRLSNDNDLTQIYSFELNSELGTRIFWPTTSAHNSTSVWSFVNGYSLKIYYSMNSNITIQSVEISDFSYKSIDQICYEDRAYLLSYEYENTPDAFKLYIHEFEIYSGDLVEIYSEEIPYQQELVASLEIDANGNPILAYFKENEGIFFRYNYAETGFNSEYLWDADFTDMPNSMNLIQTEAGEFKVLLSDGISYGTCKLQFAEGTLEITDSEDIELPKPVAFLSNFPNPFNPTTEIRFTTKDTEDAKIEIYNIKGQRIREFKMENEKCKMSKITWNGTDQNNKQVSSGVYYYTLKLDGKIETSRKMVLLK